MGQSRQYHLVNTPRGGTGAAIVLSCAIFFSAAILVASVFIALKLVSEAGNDVAPPPPPPKPIPQFTIPVTSTLQMSLLFLEAQKSGALPADYPFTWRNNSGTLDGFDQNKNLSGGFYDGGGSIKYTFPMAFSVTMLSWSVLEYWEQYEEENLLVEAVSLIQWGVDYLLAAKYQSIIFAQVGMVETDTECWMRPEDMTTKQRPTQYPCDATHPCSDLAGEMAAALAAASIIFNQPVGGNRDYALQVQDVARDLFDFANTYRGSYSDWVTDSQKEYNSSGYTDELFWGAAWLYYATGDEYYGAYVMNSENQALYLENPYKTREIFNWDKKSPGVQVLLTRLLTMGYGIDQMSNTSSPASLLANYLNEAKLYVCQYVPQNTDANFTASGQLMWAADRDDPLPRPLEYAINTAFLSILVVDYLYPALTANGTNPSTFYSDCNAQLSDIANFAIRQKNYVLGLNPMQMSYMVGYVGYGKAYPLRPYHKASSIPSKLLDDTPYNCMSGKQWLKSPDPNPSLLLGAVMGGPNRSDIFFDERQRRGQSEPKTHINAVWAGLLASLRSPVRPGIQDYTRMWVGLGEAAQKARYIQARLPKYSPPPPAPNAPVATGGAPPFDLTPPAGPLAPEQVSPATPITPQT